LHMVHAQNRQLITTSQLAWSQSHSLQANDWLLAR